MADKVDFKKSLKQLYGASTKDFVLVDVPEMQFARVDGKGDPSTSETYSEAVAWLYAVSYWIKFASKNELERDYTVPPLEGLWWANDMTAFTDGDRDQWLWTMMIMQPVWIEDSLFERGLESALQKLGTPPKTLRFDTFHEGLSAQVLHIGPYADEAPTIARLHSEFIPENRLIENGHHHEIYLSDPRRIAPEKLKTILRQPVRDR